ncbi:MAG TPA: hypothetical protein DCW74_12295 [Alteromonas australica]|uniref:Uncharacterized protein n=1 Tax=Alteromonas australica TaxID=589873 RepID=A0A350P5D2_9ALTE|nr:hypothetical protein [Alteromonas australica]|tara:strand:+ start:497 stop:703 length:207 start_codon:yes stop_codon:yes gene_type:complete
MEKATKEVISIFQDDKHMCSLVESLKMTDASQFESLCRYMWGNLTPDKLELNNVDWSKVTAQVGYKVK